MKPHYLHVDFTTQNIYQIRRDSFRSFKGIWHYHPELELHYIIKGEGIRFIGDKIENFKPGEVVLVGENLPHCWRSKQECLGQTDQGVELIVIHFLPDCFGPELNLLPETYLLPKLFEKAKNGMVIEGEARTKLIELMQRALTAVHIEKVIVMFSILKILAETEEYSGITLSHRKFYLSTETESQRLNKICSYTLANYTRDITLEEIASVCNICTTSFCRYFRLMTTKTYTDFLTEIRISNVCRLLIENKKTTSAICFECGFRNLSNFYRHFKKITSMTPFEYKNKYLSRPQPVSY